MDRHRATRQLRAHVSFKVGLRRGEILGRHHGVSMILQVAADGIVCVGQIPGGFRKVDGRPVLSHRAAFDGFDQFANIYGEIVDSLHELRLRLGSGHHQVQFANSSGLLILVVKLVAQQAPKLRRMFVPRYRRLEDLEHPRLIADPNAGGQFRRTREFGQFPQGPVRPDLAG
jgi:hypothetical protein